jgi:hypothetical protein
MDPEDEEAWDSLGNNGKPNSLLYFGIGSTIKKPREEKEKEEGK